MIKIIGIILLVIIAFMTIMSILITIQEVRFKRWGR